MAELRSLKIVQVKARCGHIVDLVVMIPFGRLTPNPGTKAAKQIYTATQTVCRDCKEEK